MKITESKNSYRLSEIELTDTQLGKIHGGVGEEMFWQSYDSNRMVDFG